MDSKAFPAEAAAGSARETPKKSAFSREAGTGSREQNASTKECEARHGPSQKA
jgi:hypothetical protein